MIRAVKEIEFMTVITHVKSPRWADAYKGQYKEVTFDTATGIVDMIPANEVSPRLAIPSAGNVRYMVLGATLKNDPAPKVGMTPLYKSDQS